MSRPRNLLTAKCDGCEQTGPGRAVCAVNGTNAFGDREVRVVTLCGPCRRLCRGRCRLHPKHKRPAISH